MSERKKEAFKKLKQALIFEGFSQKTIKSYLLIQNVRINTSKLQYA